VNAVQKIIKTILLILVINFNHECLASTTFNSAFKDQSSGIVASIKKHLVEFVHESVATLRYSVYKLGGTRFDPDRGIYIVDCSGYVDYALKTIHPYSYSNLVKLSKSEKPNSLHYYDFFTGLSSENEYWNKVEEIEELQPGDILVFRYKNKRGRVTGGHVMVVMNKPIRVRDTYHVNVADSAASGHSEDTRLSNDSGIGIGTLLLKVNPKTGHPAAFAWKVGTRWKKNVNFAMARPV